MTDLFSGDPVDPQKTVPSHRNYDIMMSYKELLLNDSVTSEHILLKGYITFYLPQRGLGISFLK